jgi:CHASE2 domain-containing sensor protein
MKVKQMLASAAVFLAAGYGLSLAGDDITPLTVALFALLCGSAFAFLHYMERGKQAR